jgi:hypothetical protein
MVSINPNQTMVTMTARLLLACAAILSSFAHAFIPSTMATTGVAISSSRIFYKDDNADTLVTAKAQVVEPRTLVIKKKPTIYPLSSLQELYDFLLEDDRLTAVK